MSSARVQRREDLMDDLVLYPEGLTVEEMMTMRGWTHDQANVAIRELRRWLGDNGDTNLPCEPQAQGERWVYKLVGRLDDVEMWSRNRMKDAESRMRTMESMLASIVSGTNGHSREGRKARLMERALRRLVEDLDDLVVDPTGATLSPRSPRGGMTP